MTQTFLPRSSDVGWEAAVTGSEEGRQFFQRRFLVFAFLVAVLSAIFLPMMAGLEAAGSSPLRSWTVSSLNPFVVAGSSLSWAVCIALLLRQFSVRALRLGEALFTVAVSECWVAMGFGSDPSAHTEFFALLAVTNTIVARAAFIPSTSGRTLAVSVIASVSVVAGTFVSHLLSNPSGAFIDRVAFTLIAATWCVVAATVATVVSAIIYGLRKQAAHAMQLGQYRLEQKIGEGGMGVVFRASHALLRRPTAVKLLVGASGNAQLQERFEREVQMTATLRHANIITVYDYGRTPDGVLYYAMEYLDGLCLQEIVETFGPLPPARVIHILAQVCAGLAEAHTHGLVHRDVKPGNIMLTNSQGAHDVVTVLDFGLVKTTAAEDLALTQVGVMIGTPTYLAPEAVLGRSADHRGDLYAVGGVAYVLLTGKPVFEANTLMGMLTMHASQPPVPPSEKLGRAVPVDLEALVLACLDKVPENRPASALELRDALVGCADAKGWTRTHANDWWQEHADLIARVRAESESQGSLRTIAVDFDRR